MEEELRGLLVERITQVCQKLAPKGTFLLEEAAKQIIAEFSTDDSRHWKQIRDYFVIRGVTRYVQKVIAQAQAARS